LAPPILDIGGARQKAALLFLAAELDQHRPEHRDVERVDLGSREVLDLLKEEHALYRRPARPAILLGPGVGGPAALVEDALPAHDVVLLRRMAEPQLVADVVRQIVLGGGMLLMPERLLL